MIESLQVLSIGMDKNQDKGRLAYGLSGKVDSPFMSFLIKTDNQNILVDAGMHPDNAAYLRSPSREIILNPEDHLPNRLKQAAGLTFEDIDLVILTHLHRDHTGYLGQFSKAKVVVQKEEYAAAVVAPAPFSSVINPLKELADRDIKWELVMGDTILMPGITLLFTPGHSAGHQVVMVDLLQTGPVILAGDAVLDLECLEKEIIPGIHTDRIESLLSLRKIKVMAKLRNAQVIPTHDIKLSRQLKKPPEMYT